MAFQVWFWGQVGCSTTGCIGGGRLTICRTRTRRVLRDIRGRQACGWRKRGWEARASSFCCWYADIALLERAKRADRLLPALSGACATIASDALMNPFDGKMPQRNAIVVQRDGAMLTVAVIKQRMQLQGSTYKSLSHCARSVLRHEGVGAFYVSYPTTLCMTVPFTALQFVAYESLSKTMNPTGRWDPYTHCTAGGLAGGLAAGVTTPLDVIKTLLQTRGSATDPELRNVRGLWHAATIIKRREGLRGFFKGLKPRIVTTMPSTAICW